jgi:hypothetical protein
MQRDNTIHSWPKHQLCTCCPNAVSAFSDFHSNGDIETSKQWVVDLRVETSQDEVVIQHLLPETPGHGTNVASGTRAEKYHRRAPECPEFPSASSFDLHPSDATIPDYADDVAEELRVASLQRLHNEIHSARANRSSDHSDDGSVLLVPGRKVHPTRSMSLPSPTQTVTVRVAKMRSFYSLENSIESPIEYDSFQAPSPEERGMRAAFNLDACVMEGIDTSRFKNRVSTRMLLSSDVNSSCGKDIEQVIECDRPRAAYNAVLGSRRNLQMAVRKLKSIQAIQFLAESENMGQS